MSRDMPSSSTRREATPHNFSILNTSADTMTSSSMDIGNVQLGQSEGVSSSSNESGAKRSLNRSPTPEPSTRAKRARKLSNADDSLSGAPLVGLRLTTETDSTTPVSAGPSRVQNAHHTPPPRDAEVVMGEVDTGGPCTDASEHTQAGSQTSMFPYLPLDVLAEILCLTECPADVLAVARTCKQLCAQLVSVDASFIWKRTRRAIGLPDPLGYGATLKESYQSDGTLIGTVGVGYFVGREPAYVAFVFDGGVCEACKESTDRTYASYSTRLRLCRKPACRKKMAGTFSSPCFLWVPSVEDSYIIYPHAGNRTWPKSNTGRRVLWSEPRSLEFQSSVDGSAAARRKDFAIAHNNIWMQFCLDLFKWRAAWETQVRETKKHNETLSENFARHEGWDCSDMLANTSYGQFYSDKCRQRERITQEELDNKRLSIARELHQSREKKHYKTVMKLRQSNVNNVWKLYQRLMSQRREYPYLPPFTSFLQLPAIQILQSAEMAKAEIDVKKAVFGKGKFMKDMIEQQLDEWAEGVKREMLKPLGGSSDKEWDNMVSIRRVPHPVLQLDARWKCKVCDSVEPTYAMDECLDFAGVCRHECREKDGMKRRKGEATQPWSVSNFVIDGQACAVVRACLRHIETKVEAAADTWGRLLRKAWLCLSCDPPLVVRTGSLIGHSHRHPIPMKIEPIEISVVSLMSPKPNLSGRAQWLLEGSRIAKQWTSKAAFGCQHCSNTEKMKESSASVQPIVEDGPSQPGPVQEASEATNRDTEQSKANTEGGDKEEKKKKKRSENRFHFNGLRSHLGSKHQIYRIRDEDFFCYDRIKCPFHGTVKDPADMILYTWELLLNNTGDTNDG